MDNPYAATPGNTGGYGSIEHTVAVRGLGVAMQEQLFSIGILRNCRSVRDMWLAGKCRVWGHTATS
jgi:hypothetical protein